MKRLIRRLIPYSLLSFVILCAIRLIVIFPPLIMRRVIDIHIPNGDIAKMIQLVLLFTGIPVAASAAQAVYQYVSAMFCRREAFLINQQVVQNILKSRYPTTRITAPSWRRRSPKTQAGSSGCGLPTYRKQSPLSARPSSPLPPSHA